MFIDDRPQEKAQESFCILGECYVPFPKVIDIAHFIAIRGVGIDGLLVGWYAPFGYSS